MGSTGRSNDRLRNTGSVLYESKPARILNSVATQRSDPVSVMAEPKSLPLLLSDHISLPKPATPLTVRCSSSAASTGIRCRLPANYPFTICAARYRFPPRSQNYPGGGRRPFFRTPTAGGALQSFRPMLDRLSRLLLRSVRAPISLVLSVVRFEWVHLLKKLLSPPIHTRKKTDDAQPTYRTLGFLSTTCRPRIQPSFGRPIIR